MINTNTAQVPPPPSHLPPLTYLPAGAPRLTSEKISLRFTADKTIIFPWRAHMLAAPGVELTEIDVRLGSSYYCIDISSFYTGQTGHDRS